MSGWLGLWAGGWTGGVDAAVVDPPVVTVAAGSDAMLMRIMLESFEDAPRHPTAAKPWYEPHLMPIRRNGRK